ncbi:dihydrofolate reductase family protein [Nocardioides hwasunensis]|uniref:Dihydrofolate reductase family protein n=1 Tax=Nocardioides hwasunensis TaxID=397258 RepID=A0ABR8MBS7_9ACTN|nr:dihydrofolate reductase family protein [Nocardioides hwasunensis]MBD3913601.1 dihydrofolate reductase family protein [Nocardioides hwasunensis]
MRRLVYLVAVTLDGFIAGPDGGDPSGSDFLPVTPDLVEHLVATWPETLPGPARAAMGVDDPGTSFDTVIEGRGSYDIGLAAGLLDAYPHLRHLVVSRTLADRSDLPVEVVPEEPLARVRELKAEAGKDIWLVGGGTLAHALLPEIDRLVLKVNPSVIGDGKRLFEGPFAHARFGAVDQVDLPAGVRVVTLDRVR